MLDFGFSEILLTSAIALVVLGPERLPKVARQVGNWMGRARAMARQLSDQLEREVSAEEFLKQQTQTKAPVMNRIAPPTPITTSPPPAEPHAEYEPPMVNPAHTTPGAPLVGAPDAHPSIPPGAESGAVHVTEAGKPPNE